MLVVMSHKTSKIRSILTISLLLPIVTILMAAVPVYVSAAESSSPPASPSGPGAVPPALIEAESRDPEGTSCSILPGDYCSSGKDGAGIWGLLRIILNILTAGVGIAAVAGIVWASIIYTTAGDSSEKTKKAKDTIVQIVWGLVAYGFMFIILQFLIPGGALR